MLPTHFFLFIYLSISILTISKKRHRTGSSKKNSWPSNPETKFVCYLKIRPYLK